MSLRDKVLDKIRKTMGWGDGDIADDIEEPLDPKHPEVDWSTFDNGYEEDLIKHRLEEYKKHIENAMIWHCPHCGFAMRYMDENDTSWWCNEILTDAGDYVFCTSDKCTWNDTPLKIHHPTSYDRSAGDSWSISWLK
jgi:hypothetical protein